METTLVRMCTDRVTEKSISDGIVGRALVFDAQFVPEINGVRMSPLGVVENPKFRIIHYLTFAAGARVRSRVDDDTDFEQAPEYALAHVLSDILSRVLFLRQLHGPSLEILVCRVDGKEIFRQVPVDPAGAAAFSYIADGRVVVDLRCQFGWRSNLGIWSLFSSALEYFHTHTTFQNASVATVGVAAISHVQIGPMRDNRVVVPHPPDCAQVVGDGVFTGFPFFLQYYVDDGVLVEGRFFADGRRCTTAVPSLATDHFRLLDNRGSSEPPLLLPAKITHLQTRLEVFGWILDTQLLTVTMTEHTRMKLRRLLQGWLPSRKVATARQVSELTGFLMHVSFALRL